MEIYISTWLLFFYCATKRLRTSVADRILKFGVYRTGRGISCMFVLLIRVAWPCSRCVRTRRIKFPLTGWAALSEVFSRTLLNVSQWWSARRASSPVHSFHVVDPSDRVPRIINHILQFTVSSWGRTGGIMSACDWLAAVIVCEKRGQKRGKNKKKYGNAVSAPPWHGTFSSSLLYHQTCRYPVPQ